jgi:hypothetical protein
LGLTGRTDPDDGERRLLDHPGDGVGQRLLEHDVTSTGLILLEYKMIPGIAVGEYEGVNAFV